MMAQVESRATYDPEVGERLSYIEVITKKPGEAFVKERIRNTLKALQAFVGGYIETVTLGDVVVICDEEGTLKGRPYNCTLNGIDFVGNIILAGVEGEEFASLPENVLMRRVV